jgi:hypothetical protein
MIASLSRLWDTATSPAGGWLTNRAIRFFGHIIAMVVIMKLTWMSELTEAYFTIYVAFIAGDASLAQVLKTRVPDKEPS